MIVEAIMGLDNIFSTSDYLKKDGSSEPSFSFYNAVFCGTHQ